MQNKNISDEAALKPMDRGIYHKISFLRKALLKIPENQGAVYFYTILRKAKNELETAYVLEQGLLSKIATVQKEAAEQITKKILSPQLQLRLFHLAIQRNYSLIGDLSLDLILSEKNIIKKNQLLLAYVYHHLDKNNPQQKNKIYKELCFLVNEPTERTKIFLRELERAPVYEKEFLARHILNYQSEEERFRLIKEALTFFPYELRLIITKQISTLKNQENALFIMEEIINNGTPDLHRIIRSQLYLVNENIRKKIEEKLAIKEFAPSLTI